MNVETIRGTISFPTTLKRKSFRKNHYSAKERNFVARKVHVLPLSEFLVAHLHFWRGWTLTEIADRFELPYAQVMVHHDRALWRLRRMHRKRFGKHRGKPKVGFLTL
ncbi:MAG: sigma-70 family RNA polymerase sigma factor [Bdellovibrionales bacterium]|nr:sigma-70 family RNA polymerase sigma factor [Bdellovibrionales bacterium]